MSSCSGVLVCLELERMPEVNVLVDVCAWSVGAERSVVRAFLCYAAAIA